MDFLMFYFYTSFCKIDDVIIIFVIILCVCFLLGVLCGKSAGVTP